MLGLDGPAAALAPAAGPGVRGVVVPTNNPLAPPSRSGGALSPSKLIEMSDGFASYTAATANVDRDGAGQAEATRELVNLLLSPDGSTLQDILVDESAALGDAAVRQALRQLLIEGPSTIAAPLGLQPPAPLEALLAPSAEDERVLKTASELSQMLGPRVQEQVDAATSTPPEAAQLTEAVSTFVSDAQARDDAAKTLEGAAALSRRIGAMMLRRGADRLTATAGLPDAAREALASGNRALADAIEPSVDATK
jgi:hypothetical protein